MTGIANNATLARGPTDYRDLRIVVDKMNAMCRDFASNLAEQDFRMRCSECGQVSAVHDRTLTVCKHVLAKLRELYSDTHVGPSAGLPITLAGMQIYIHKNAPKEHIEC